MTIEDGAFLLAKGGTVRAVHVEHQPLEARALMDPVNPMAREVGQGDEIFVCC